MTTCASARLSVLSAVALLLLPALPARAEPAMWVIRDEDSTIYLIGTVDLLRRETEWNAAKVKKTVTESSELWLDVANFDDQAGVLPIMTRYGIDTKKKLSNKLNARQKRKLAKLAATYSVPMANLELMKPWMAAFTIAIQPLQKAGYDPNAGVDRLLQAQAEAEGDKINGFETAEDRILFFAELPESEQIDFLEGILNDAEKGIARLEQLAKAWTEGDNETLSNLLVADFKKGSPVLYEKFLVRRNIAWSEKIAEILKGSGVQLIAVGAAHVAGPDSLQVQLAKRGIKVEQY
jgi:uncharacterized protein YbaP (TraB family)